MKDKQTETNLRLISLQLESWKKLNDLITYGLDKAKPIISADQERQFTEVRANLFQETEHVLRELNLLGDLSGRAMNVINRGTSLRVCASFRTTTPAALKRNGTAFSSSWEWRKGN